MMPTGRPQPLRPRRRHAGLTLIELLVALIIFAILGVMAYRAVSAAADNRERIAAEFGRWHDIANFFQVTEIDLTQFVRRPLSVQLTPTASLTLSRANDGTTREISFLKLDGGAGAVRRRGYRFDGGRIIQLRWPGTDAQTPPAEYPILDHVKASSPPTASATRSGRHRASAPR
jgi:general secretion pathway protein J